MRKAIWVLVGILVAGTILWVVFKPKHVKRTVEPGASFEQRTAGFAPTFPLPITTAGAKGYFNKANQGNLKDLLDRFRKAADLNQKREIGLQIERYVPQTREDIELIKSILLGKEWNEELFQICTILLRNLNDPAFAKDLIEILEKQRKYIKMVEREDLSGLSENEARDRGMLTMILMTKLGLMKSEEAVSILKEYLDYQSTQYVASEALGRIGDESASEVIQEKAYKGEEVNYGGLGLKAAKKVVEDLQNIDKKNKWEKISDQILNIENPGAKPYLKELFNHEDHFVRKQSATAYSKLVNRDDVQDIKEMAKNQDWHVRYSAIDAMKNIKEESFDDDLFNLLLNDPQNVVRKNAAVALGYKHIQKAVPYLEKALNDKELMVRRASFVALCILTGKKYDFVGRNSSSDQTADWERNHPGFYQ